MPEVHVVEHPLIAHKMTHMRQKATSSSQFRALVREVSVLLAYEVTRDLPLHPLPIETPLQPMTGQVLEGRKPVFVSILRAGNGMLDGMLQVLPTARVGHVGLYRDPETLAAVEYYFKMPSHMEERDVIVVDPMLATGHSAIAAMDKILATKPRSTRLVCLIAAPEGIEAFHERHPGTPVYVAAVDERLNDKGYILPGLGDAGDRLYGTEH